MLTMKSASLATLTDVAREAGVGLATASRVINGGVNVSPATLKIVQKAIRRLGYKPNHAARVLKGGQTKTVGLLVPSIADTFFASCAEAAEKVARAHDSLLIFAVSNNDRDLEASTLGVLMRHRPDGMLIVPADATDRRFLSFMRQSSIPIVTFDRPVRGCSSVLTDNFEAARLATAHLVGHGYKRILCLGLDPDLFTIRERLRGYCQAMEEAGLPPIIDTLPGKGIDAAEQSLKAHLAGTHPPDAIFSLKNSATIETFRLLQSFRITIPTRMALLGFDDFELAETLRPSISVIAQPVESIGRRAAELLFARLGSATGSHPGRKLASEQIVLPSTLTLRRSCGCEARTGSSGKSIKERRLLR